MPSRPNPEAPVREPDRSAPWALLALAVACAVFLLVAGCAAAPPAPRTPRESWYTAVAAYDAALAAAAEYRRDCSRKPKALQSRCRAVVLDLRGVNDEALGWKELGDMALDQGDDAFLASVTEELDSLRADLEAKVVADLEDGPENGPEKEPAP
jgi:hypothetical protein